MMLRRIFRRNQQVRREIPTDEELAGRLGSTLHTQWRRQGNPDASPCMCDHCRQIRRELWFRLQCKALISLGSDRAGLVRSRLCLPGGTQGTVAGPHRSRARCDFGFEGVAAGVGLTSGVVRGDRLRPRPVRACGGVVWGDGPSPD